ncbi:MULTISPECIES: protease inhibitor I42 family protein [Streptomyces]|uniref:Protease inhibitor I42 family protein n=1 Tax=Streptomyces nigrescens TaxID=1920 RepID=A0ABY7J7T3_STRNI|nr:MULTISPECIES: protease inhibitor I42 family protein [Streptomyces]WAU06633.1 protease inhibitor I42 family protein [Streptomyces nigrescens]WDT55561.1 protease inhibitor I42 family protein [Streptomyces sp. G7(2002)]
MENSGISRGLRTLVIVVAITTLLIALHSIFSQLSAPEVYDADDTEIAVSPGDRFSVRVPDSPAGGYHWIIAEPRPDPAVLKAAGGRVTTGGPPAGSARHLSFEAVRPGRTDLRLLRCRRCGPGAADEAGSRSLNFRVTVR